MVVVLIEGLFLKNDKGQPVIEIDPGTQLNAISYGYLPRGTEVYSMGGSTDPDYLKNETYIFYLGGRFVAVPKKKCFVPVAVGWRFNI